MASATGRLHSKMMVASMLMMAVLAGATPYPAGNVHAPTTLLTRSEDSKPQTAELKVALAAAETYYRRHVRREAMGWWEEDPWTANDQAYRAARLGLYKTLIQAKGSEATVAASLVQSCGAEERAHPLNTMATFRYAEAVYIANHYGVVRQEDLLSAEQCLRERPASHNYEVARTLFLIRAANRWPDQMTLLGERLVERDPDDFQVKSGLVTLFQSPFFPPDKRLPLLCAESMVRQMPNSPSVYAALSSVYYRMWLASGCHDAKAKTETLRLSNKVVAMLPKNDPTAAKTIQFIAQLQNQP